MYYEPRNNNVQLSIAKTGVGKYDLTEPKEMKLYITWSIIQGSKYPIVILQ